jgi:hypothetical protein
MNSESRHEPTDPSGAKPQASQSPVVRRALPSERSAVAAMVAAAFSADPAWTFIFGSEYERLAQHFAAALFDVRARAPSHRSTRKRYGSAIAPRREQRPTYASSPTTMP